MPALYIRNRRIVQPVMISMPVTAVLNGAVEPQQDDVACAKPVSKQDRPLTGIKCATGVGRKKVYAIPLMCATAA